MTFVYRSNNILTTFLPCWSQFFFRPQKFLNQNFFGPKIFFDPKFVFPQKFLGQKFFWTQICFWPKTFVDNKIVLDPQFLWTKNFLDPKFFCTTIFADTQFFWSQNYYEKNIINPKGGISLSMSDWKKTTHLHVLLISIILNISSIHC